MPRPRTDYSFYLVTDPNGLPAGQTVVSQVQAAIENGATIVQIREKDAGTRDFVKVAEQIHKITKQKGIPLIINDRVDVALAIDAEGVHVGQDDMSADTVRALIGPNKIVGVSVHDAEEMDAVLELNGDLSESEKIVDYVGIGAVFGTKTKDLGKKTPIGVEGVKNLVQYANGRVRSVSIGGINSTNVESVMSSGVDGVAVVSCIMGAPDAGQASTELYRLIISSRVLSQPIEEYVKDDILAIVRKVASTRPLVHHITNNVVKHFSASAALAYGASPIMSETKGEFNALSSIPHSNGLLINIGMPLSDTSIYTSAMSEYNFRNRPVVLDPVGVGATSYRQTLVKSLLSTGPVAVIKGNEGELFALADKVSESLGVDSLSANNLDSRCTVASQISKAYHTVVLMTGDVDILQSGSARAIIRNGHELMGRITGSGCTLGSLVTATSAAVYGTEGISSQDVLFFATLAASLVYTIAGERAAQRVEGPGTFSSALVDEIAKIVEETKSGETGWIEQAKFSLDGIKALDPRIFRYSEISL